MDITANFKASIFYGWSTLAMLFVAGLALGLHEVSVLAVLATGLAYVAQCLATTALIVEQKAYGPDVTADDDGMYRTLIERSRAFNRVCFTVWAICVVVVVIALGLLVAGVAVL